MSIPVSAGAGSVADASPGLHVPTGGGITTWFNGDILTVKLTAQQSGALGLIEATVSPGGGRVPHVHPGTDETFYLISG